jgi:hypothetical protein
MNHWTYDQFIAFVMLYAASADLQLTDEEMSSVHERAGDGFDEVMSVFQNSNDTKCLDIMLSLKEKYMTSESSHETVAREIHQIFLSDHDYAMIERGVGGVLKKLL